ncbi:MAG: TetR/AcrR family transcriptional regulator [Spirochaetales bacterium]|nr:TetR/AcrR family transcriptional regulator [Candidatus Physcosoma equi]
MNPSQKEANTKIDMIKKAIELFKEKGVEPVSVKEICDACSVSRNTFYYYFVSKDRLFDYIGDYISSSSKERIVTVLEEQSYYGLLWEYYRAYLLTEIDMGPDIINHVCLSRTDKGQADTYSYIDEKLAKNMTMIINLAKANGEIQSTRSTEDLLWVSYAMIRGTNIKWCFQWGASDLIGESALGMDTLFCPREDLALSPKYKGQN